MVIHFIVDTEHDLTKNQIIQRMKATAKEQCSEILQGALSLDIRMFSKMPLDIASCQKKRIFAEKGFVRPVHLHRCQPSLQEIQEALCSIIYEKLGQVVELKVSQFYSIRPRIEMILNTMDDFSGS
ncbi:hypothetical protein BACPU_28270 [Bacillus pumilus]|nr:hypothetical protein BACPU_28270 [Bacillus pumilus]